MYQKKKGRLLWQVSHTNKDRFQQNLFLVSSLFRIYYFIGLMDSLGRTELRNNVSQSMRPVLLLFPPHSSLGYVRLSHRWDYGEEPVPPFLIQE
jgi:hypothetical protein